MPSGSSRTRLDQLARGVQVNSFGAARRGVRSQTYSAVGDRGPGTNAPRGLIGVSPRSGELPVKTAEILREADAAIAALETATAAPEGEDSQSLAPKASELSTRIAETARKVQKLRTRISELPQIGRTANEIARKSNLIALNTSIQGEAGGASTASFSLLVDEVTAVSQRAQLLNNEIRSITEALASEVGDLAATFGQIREGSGEVLRGFDKSLQRLNDLRVRSSELSAVRTRLSEFGSEHAAESEKIAEVVSTISRDRSDENLIREADSQIQKLSTLVENLRDSVSDVRGVGSKHFAAKQEGTAVAGLPFERINPDPAELTGEN